MKLTDMVIQTIQTIKPIKRNIFDDLPLVSVPVASKLKDELDQYLACPVEDVRNPFVWWVQNQVVYPRLSRMGLDYLSIPGMCYIIL